MHDDPALATLAAAPRLPLGLLERLFDALPDVVFFANDHARPLHPGHPAAARPLGPTKRAQLVGRRTDELFPGGLGDRYREQDEAVLRDGVEIVGQLELHLYPHPEPGGGPGGSSRPARTPPSPDPARGVVPPRKGCGGGSRHRAAPAAATRSSAWW